ncbi:zinc-dependent alcohol dehydrogenase family protein [Dyadobacter sp. OTU695]|uniref:zinc-dependent alcohol dehydrogenase family protein n=1 Tax=Dyadobacter sp. OTU695 TaxID=3043860 RepID=UPI00313EDF4E
MEKQERIPETMRAMVLSGQARALTEMRVAVPYPGPGQVLVRVNACGVCRTDLHIVDQELKEGKYPLILGHEVIGKIVAMGKGIDPACLGQVVGVPWLAYTCGKCRYCLKGKENLCEKALFTGYTVDGGYAEYMLAYQRYVFPIPGIYQNAAASPLLCAGLIGFRSYSMLDPDCEKIGIYGFGAAAHILIQLAVAQGKLIYAFSKKGDHAAQQLALRLGATWAGDSSQQPPCPMDGAILFAPAGELVPKALSESNRGAMVVCGGIHMSDIPTFPYELLWGERTVKSVANLTTSDAANFFEQATLHPITTSVRFFELSEANQALQALREGSIQGAAVLRIH